MTNTFNEAIHNNHGQKKPKIMRTDGLRPYIDGFKVIGSVKHIAKCKINKPHTENNRIERLNRIFREGVKAQRSWRSHKSQISEGQRIYYNFLKPHQALKEKTPAEVAIIKVHEVSSWSFHAQVVGFYVNDKKQIEVVR